LRAGSTQGTAFQLTDAQFSVIAVATPGKPGVVIDRIAYSAYGEAARTLRSDVNGDGFVNKDDYNGVIRSRPNTTIGSAGYVVEADLDRDGKVAQSDYDIAVADDGKSSSGGVGDAGLFSKGVRNGVGYCGYIFNDESGLYTVRFRSYSPTLGRWLERDPAGYVDGMDLYEYVRGGPIAAVDPWGLQAGLPTPDTVDCECAEQPSRRDLVFDFIDWVNPALPWGTNRVGSWVEVVEEIERRALDGAVGRVWTISAHGSCGTLHSGAERFSVLNIQRLGRLSDEQMEQWCESERAEMRALLRFLELAQQHLSDGGTLELAACEVGGGESGRNLGEFLARRLPGVQILLYETPMKWKSGLFWLSSEIHTEEGEKACPRRYCVNRGHRRLVSEAEAQELLRAHRTLARRSGSTLACHAAPQCPSAESDSGNQ
jgi:RHS repeat-associated protein